MELSQRQIINRVYKDICGFEIPQNDVKKVRSSKGSPVYGEITVTSTQKLFEKLKVTKQDVLYDLGSGVGKVILCAGLFTPIKKAVGVELSKFRYEDAMLALDRAKDFDHNVNDKCRFLNSNIMDIDLKPASLVYTCSTAFSVDFMRKLAARLADFTHDFRLVSLQSLPHEKHFELTEIVRLDMSWQRQTPVHIYRRR